jgi:16S rRNA processing protein RimM
MTDAERHLVVGRLRKPHGLKGSVAVFPLTDSPEAVFAAGQELRVRGLDGEFEGGALEVEWGKPYHREWLLKFRGHDTVEAVQGLREKFLSAPQSRLPAPAAGEVYLHELEGFAVARADGTALGIVSAYFETPAGVMIEVQGPKREFLLPFRKEFVLAVDREARRLTVEPPDGLLED